MRKHQRIFGRKTLAILGCLALLYFAGGGTLLHHHTGGGPDTTCSVCHSLHVPVLAAAALELLPQQQQSTRPLVTPQIATPLDSFALHRASRAPPLA